MIKLNPNFPKKSCFPCLKKIHSTLNYPNVGGKNPEIKLLLTKTEKKKI